MGCVVNGPGELADADFGYMGGAPGRVNLYVGRECVEKNVPADEADERLIALIKAHGRSLRPAVLTYRRADAQTVAVPHPGVVRWGLARQRSAERLSRRAALTPRSLLAKRAVGLGRSHSE